MAAPALPCGSELDIFQEDEARKIMTLKLSKSYFEEEEQGVVEFVKFVVNANKSNGIVLQEWTIKSMYMAKVYNLYACTSSMAEGLVKQLESPLYLRFWEKQTALGGFNLRNLARGTFRWSLQKPTKAQKTKDKGVVIMGNGEIVVIVPFIGLLALDELIYTEVVEEIRSANPGIEDHTVDEVWNGILENLFHDPMESTRQEKRKEADQQRLQNKTHRKHCRSKVSRRRVTVEASTNDHAPVPDHVAAVPSSSQAGNSGRNGGDVSGWYGGIVYSYGRENNHAPIRSLLTEYALANRIM